MSDGRFALCTKDFHMKMCQATGDGERHAEAARCIQGAELKVVV